MPMYEFECQECGEIFEELLGINESTDGLKCPKCQAKNPRKVLSVFSSATGGSSGASCTPSGST
ncbi:MAG: zinc ribbon domain-containing protein [Deltaproteobacteria bacterium]|nr:MAG: zinc ribbon domain-containing protein [Deltaproteobacteria bacterium]